MSGSRRPLLESYDTSDQAALERAGYTVIVTLAETAASDGELEGW